MQQMEGGGLGIQWGCEQTFTGSEATDETTSSGTRYSKLKQSGGSPDGCGQQRFLAIMHHASCIIICIIPHLFP